MTTDIEIEKLEAERDAALSELAKLRAEAEWRPISEAPQKASAFGAELAELYAAIRARREEKGK